VGDVEIKFIHTPGHTPGSQCFLVGDRLVSGDTLFIGGCGRVDLPGANPSQMWESLTQKLARLDDNVRLFPGHNYGGDQSTMGREKQNNPYLTMPSLQDWLSMMGH
jgi:glyoxylase-like metal-dependent hydrolase (beta-lactamase superfamily II)